MISHRKDYLSFIYAVLWVCLYAAPKACAHELYTPRGKLIDADSERIVLSCIHNKDYSALDRLTPAGQAKLIPLLITYIAPQYTPDDPYGLAVGATLVHLKAELPLRDLILASKKGGGAAYEDRLDAFNALSFMRSKAAVAVLAAFLDDVTIFPGPGGCLGSEDQLAGWAFFALSKMSIPGAPITGLSGAGAQDEYLQAWRDWWRSNKDKFQGSGGFP